MFEAHAAAAAYAAYAREPERFMLVMDMGAGTTDFAGFERLEAARPTLSEILHARQSCGLAGDEIDDIIAHLLMARYKGKDRAGQASTWRSLRLSARALKRDLFQTGKASAQIGRAKLVVKRKELLQAPRFKDFTRQLTEICAASVRAVAAHAERANASAMSILLAGGGANLPFLASIARAAAQRGAPKLKVEVALFGSDWLLPDDMDGRAADALPQVAISLGGALAALETGAAPTPEPVR